MHFRDPKQAISASQKAQKLKLTDGNNADGKDVSDRSIAGPRVRVLGIAGRVDDVYHGSTLMQINGETVQLQLQK